MKKRILSVIIAICLLLTFALTTAFAVGNTNAEDAEQTLDTASSVSILGDVNLDGVISARDAVEIQKYLAGMVDFDDIAKSVADTNGDGQINIFDATRIQKYVAGVIDEL
ncbi:MAG: dockerin type I repeat-containing protein [Acutalibacteraceae bacterium]